MKIVGLTGGIGSGKSTIAKMFKTIGVPIYIADEEAKKLMNSDLEVRKKIIALLGEDAYIGNKLNRPYIAEIVFNDKEKLAGLNAIVHPAVASHFEDWKNDQHHADYVIKEAAILFENGGYKQCDYTILVTAPLDVRISRVLKRDNISREQALARANNQWKDSKKIPLADFIIHNKYLEDTEKQVNKIHLKITP